MSRTLALVTVALAAGLGYDESVALVEQMSATLPEGDIEAGRAVAAAVGDQVCPV